MSEPVWVYLAQPIDLTHPDHHIWRHGVVAFRDAFLALGGTRGIYRPSEAFQVKGEPSGGFIRWVNEAALLRCDVVVAFWPAEVESVGVPVEISWALEEGTRVVLVSDRPVTWFTSLWKLHPEGRFLWIRPEPGILGWADAGRFAATQLDNAIESSVEVLAGSPADGLVPVVNMIGAAFAPGGLLANPDPRIGSHPRVGLGGTER